MALIGLSMDYIEEYISKTDPAKGTENELRDATQFVLGTLSARMFALLSDRGVTFSQKNDDSEEVPVMNTELRAGQVAYETVQYGLRGWENFNDSDGNDISFTTTKKVFGGVERLITSAECMDRLGKDLIFELANRIEEISSPSVADLKT